jgi:sugar O-acyltransferase, sialic acid O-acetyltransferase NeuD family
MRHPAPTKIFGLYGAGGFAREVMPIVAEYVALATQGGDERHRIFFIETAPTRTEINGYPVISEEAFFSLDCEHRYFNVAIADSKARARIAQRCIDRGAEPFTIQSSRSTVLDGNDIGHGAILCPYSTITANAKIGNFFHCNIYSYVAHDCVIGDYVTFAPNVHCNGNVHIGDHAYIGTGAIIKQGSPDKPLVIGEGAVIGMGAVVTKSVPPYTTVVGNPARPHRTQPAGEHTAPA